MHTDVALTSSALNTSAACLQPEKLSTATLLEDTLGSCLNAQSPVTTGG